MYGYEQPDKDVEELRAEHLAEEKHNGAVNLELQRRKTQRQADEEEAARRRVVSRQGSEYTMSRTRWLWRDRMPLGGLSLVAGRGDMSKSTLFAQMCAWITTGDMKGEYYGMPQNVLYVVNEDSISQTVIPRMVAHGADMTRVFFLEVQSPLGKDALTLPADADRLRDEIRNRHAVGTFIDPLSANVTGRANDSRETRNTYQEVNNVAEDTSSAIVGLAHTRKAGALDVMEAILGSSEQGNVARSVHGLDKDNKEDGARILSCEKLNQGQRHLLPSLRFCIVSHNVQCTDGTEDWTSAPRIEWLEETMDTASDMMAERLEGNTGADECAHWLLGYIIANGGEMLASDVRSAPEAKKYSSSMMDRARLKAGIRSKRLREQAARSVWYVPT